MAPGTSPPSFPPEATQQFASDYLAIAEPTTRSVQLRARTLRITVRLLRPLPAGHHVWVFTRTRNVDEEGLSPYGVQALSPTLLKWQADQRHSNYRHWLPADVLWLDPIRVQR
jgi:hypothetical protein